MTLKGKYTFQVRPQDCDFTEKIAIPVLGDYILQTAGINADDNGFGMTHLHRLERTWVLSRLAIEMKRLPGMYENIIIETWIESIGRIATTRNFKILDGNEIVIGGACSNWAMIDIASRQPVDLQTLDSFTDYIEGSPSIVEKPARIVVANGKAIETRRVRYSDIDSNRHANSMKYLE
jgi:acyl-ACP thioesterase